MPQRKRSPRVRPSAIQEDRLERFPDQRDEARGTLPRLGKIHLSPERLLQDPLELLRALPGDTLKGVQVRRSMRQASDDLLKSWPGPHLFLMNL